MANLYKPIQKIRFKSVSNSGLHEHFSAEKEQTTDTKFFIADSHTLRSQTYSRMSGQLIERQILALLHYVSLGSPGTQNTTYRLTDSLRADNPVNRQTDKSNKGIYGQSDRWPKKKYLAHLKENHGRPFLSFVSSITFDV